MVEPLLPKNHGLSLFCCLDTALGECLALFSHIFCYGCRHQVRYHLFISCFTWLQTDRRHNNAKNTTNNDENPQKSSYCKNSTQACYSYQENVVLCVGVIMAGAASFSCQERTKLFHGNSLAVPWPHQLTVCVLWARAWLGQLHHGFEAGNGVLSSASAGLQPLPGPADPGAVAPPGWLYLCTS